MLQEQGSTSAVPVSEAAFSPLSRVIEVTYLLHICIGAHLPVRFINSIWDYESILIRGMCTLTCVLHCPE